MMTSAVGFTFLVVAITGVIFKLFFKNHTLEEVHGNLGLLMIVAALFHIFHNWKSLTNHLKMSKVFLVLIPIFLVLVVSVVERKSSSGLNPRMVIGKMTQASIEELAIVFKKKPEEVIEHMKKDGWQVQDQKQSLSEVMESKSSKNSLEVIQYFTDQSEKIEEK